MRPWPAIAGWVTEVRPSARARIDKLGEGERAAGIATGWLQRNFKVDAET